MYAISQHHDWDRRSGPTSLTPGDPPALQAFASTDPEAGDVAFGVIHQGGFYHTRLQRKLAQVFEKFSSGICKACTS